MQSLKLASTMIACAMAMFAASPYVGTWKLDPAKAKFKTGSSPKEQIVTISESGSDIDIVVKGVAADGKPVSSHYTVPAAGGPGKIMESSVYDGISNRRISDRERETSYSKNGKVVYTVHSKVSADGKTLTTNVKGLNSAGQTVEGTMVQTKQ